MMTIFTKPLRIKPLLIAKPLLTATVPVITFAATLHASLAAGETATSGDAIFARARTAALAMTYPAIVDYTVAVDASSGATHTISHYPGQAITATSECRVHAFSREEDANPAVPHGINVVMSIGANVTSGSAPVGSANGANAGLGLNLAKPGDLPSFGIPELSPLYLFGIRETARPISRTSTLGGPPIIGRVSGASHRYAVSLIGEEIVDGRTTDHLSLQPLIDPHRDRLRDLWISSTDSTVVQARMLGNFTRAPETDVPWIVHFETIDGATYIAGETPEGSIRTKSRPFEAVTISFENIAEHHGPRDVQFAVPHDFGDSAYFYEPSDRNGEPSGCQ